MFRIAINEDFTWKGVSCGQGCQQAGRIYSNHKILTTHAMHDSQPCVRYGRRILLLHILNIHRADKAYVKTVYL